jgi:SAM-dependent methyltransferase
MYRWPKETARSSHVFYQRKYSEGMTTGMPASEEIRTLRESMFSGTEKDLCDKVTVLKHLMPKGRVLDYGCSWGYGTFQLVGAGFDTVGFEISKPRAEFGRSHLGVSIISDESALVELAGSFDAVFASHVLEHVPIPAAVFDRIAMLLKPNGLLLAFVPNCDGHAARKFGVKWGPMCCEKHPLALDAGFLERNLPNHGLDAFSFSTPYSHDLLAQLLQTTQLVGNLDGDELAVYAWKRKSQRHISR